MVVAAGHGERFGAAKLQAPLRGRTVIDYAVRPLAMSHPAQLVLVAPKSAIGQWSVCHPANVPLQMVAGGLSRADSVRCGLEALQAQASDEDWVLVHDGARPCVWHSDVVALMEAADPKHGGLLAVSVVDTLKREDQNRVVETVERHGLWQAQTPQMFRFASLQAALKQARDTGQAPSDESMAVEQIGHRPRLVPGRPNNLKLTWPEDLARVEMVLREEDPDHAYWSRL